MTMFFLRKQPTYEERLRSNDQRPTVKGVKRVISFTMFILFVITCTIFSVYFRLVRFKDFKKIDPRFLGYFDTFGYWFLTAAWHKVIESVHFQEVDVVSPSLEIGFCRGNISALHFKGKRFDIGSEFLHFEAAKAKKKFEIWDHVVSDNLLNIAFKDETFSTVCSVHVIDHVEHVDRAISEVARILRPGGQFYFSGFSDQHFSYSLIWQLLNLFSRRRANAFAAKLVNLRNCYAMYTPEEWRELLAGHGLVMRRHVYTESGLFAFLRYFLHFSFVFNHCFDFAFIKSGPLRPLLEKVFLFFYVSIGYPEYVKTKRNDPALGDDFFIVAQKPVENPTEEPRTGCGQAIRS